MIAVAKLVSQAKLRIERARAANGLVDIAIRTFRRYSTDEGGSLAASLTYYTFFSIFPLLLFAASVLGYLTFLNPDLRRELLASGLEAFPLLGSILTEGGLAAIEANKGALALTGLALALYSGSGAVVALAHALNRIARVEDDSNFLAKRLRSLKWLAVLGGAGVLSIALGGIANYAAGLFGETGLKSAAASLLGHGAGVVVSLVLFLTAFKFLPVGERAWSAVLPGSLVAAVGFELLKVAGAVYLERGSAHREATFGAFAAAAGLLVACYLLSQIMLLAAEVNAVVAERRSMRQSQHAH